jgi:chromate transporter
MKKLKSLFNLFITLFKIGLFTFGGGYAMIAVLQRELVERKKWIEQEEFLDLIAIAESTPGPIAINSATYIGYKVAGVLGSVFATLGMVLPSFIIIYLISLVFDKFLSFVFVQYAFRGIQACIAFLILSAGFKMFKSLKKTPLNLTLFILTVACLVGLTLFAVDFSTIFYILIGGVVGLIVYFIELAKNKKTPQNDKDNGGEK